MPIIKSAIKRTKQASKNNTYNVAVKNDVKKKFKAVRDEIATGKVKDEKSLAAALKEIDIAVRKGVIKKQTAARKKSRLTKAYNSVATKPFGTEKPGKPGTKAKTPAKKKPAAKKIPDKKPTAKKVSLKKTTKK